MVVGLLLGLLVSAGLAPGTAPGLGAVGHLPSAPPTAAVAGAPAALPEAPARPSVVAPAFAPGPAAVELGPLPSATPLTVLVGLGSPDLHALAAQATAAATPGTGRFARPLTAAQVAGELGAPPAEVDRAQAYFEGYHLKATASADRFLLTVTGPAADVGAAFGTRFEEYRLGDRVVFSHPTAATLPAGLPWYGALGLGNLSAPVPLVAGASAPASPAPAATAAVRPSGTCAPGGGPLPPCALWTAYDYSNLLAAGDNGSGVTVAVVDSFDSAYPQSAIASDFSAFTSQYGLPSGGVTYAYPVPAGATLNTTPSDGWADEDALDLQWARATAPGDTVLDTLAANTNAALYSAVDWIVAGDRAEVISLSWGEQDTGIYNVAVSGGCSAACNASSDGSYALLHPVLLAAAAEGITVLVASGDCGAADGTSGVSTDYPASDPYVTGVGGTALTVNSSTGAWVSEVGWSGNATGAVAPGCQNQGGSGGGYSPFVRPAWQAGTGIGSPEKYRGVPDVALNAATAVALTFYGTASAVSGTSAAAPAWAGIVAVGDQMAGRSLGFLDPSLYQILRNGSYGSDFHDITRGDNGYPAGVGWDPVTGLGTPIVNRLLPDLVRGALTPSNLSVGIRADRTVGPAPLTVNFSAVGSGGVGPYPDLDFLFGDGNATWTTLPYATHTYAAAGVYNATVLLFDAAGNSSLAVPVVVVVGGGALLGVTLAANVSAAAAGSPVSFQALVAGGTAPYTYWIGFGDGSSTVPGPGADAVHDYPVPGSYCAWVVVADAAVPTDGGGSAPVSIDIGGVPRIPCGVGAPLGANLSSAVVAADLPGDLPLRFSASGGSGTLSTWIDTGDPYATACQCGIFRTAGPHEITLYANDSLGAGISRSLNVTLYPALRANFSASVLSGPAPLLVNFSATASGGHNASAARTVWTFGNGSAAGSGARTSFRYTVPGEYLATASLEDAGHGNASAAFLLDVTAPGSAALGIDGTFSAAVRSPVGLPVAFRANAVDGGAGPVTFRWNLSDGSSGFGPTLVEAPLPGGLPAAANGSLAFSVTVIPAAGASRTVSGTLPDFFGEPYTALALAAVPGPTAGTTPFRWDSTLTASGMPGTTVQWSFGDGSGATGPTVSHLYLVPGNDSVLANVSDAAGDAWPWSQAVAVGGNPIGPLSEVVAPGNFLCYAPCRENFSANLTGGVPPVSVRWSSGPGVAANGTSVTLLFPDPGPVRLWANATDALGEVADLLVPGLVLAPTALRLDLTVAPATVAPGGIFHLVASYEPLCGGTAPGSGCGTGDPPLVIQVRLGSPNGSGLFAPLLTKAVPPAAPTVGVSVAFPAPPAVLGRFWFALVPASPAYSGSAVVAASVAASAGGTPGFAGLSGAAAAAAGLLLLGAVGGLATGTGAWLLSRRAEPERPPADRPRRRLSP